MRACRIKHFTPAPQLVDRFCRELRFEPGADQKIHFRGIEQRLYEGSDIETSATNNNGSFLDLTGALDPFLRLVGPACGRVALAWLRDIDAVMAHARTFIAGWFGSADVEITVDLARISANDGGVKFFGKHHCDRRLACCCRTADDAEPTGGQSAAPLRPTSDARSSTVRARHARAASCRAARRTAT